MRFFDLPPHSDMKVIPVVRDGDLLDSSGAECTIVQSRFVGSIF